VVVFDPITHMAHFLDVKGRSTRERQNVSIIIKNIHAQTEPMRLHPGPARLSIENRTSVRVLPAAWIMGRAIHHMISKRKPLLTAKRLLSNQTFRELYGAEPIDIDQHFNISSLSFLFTDLKNSTALYERVGDLVAHSLVRMHFDTLTHIVASQAGAIVKTTGDAVMATFPTPDRAVAAALRMREAMDRLNQERNTEDLLLKIGIHEGPCLAVMENGHQDYFGRTVNIAARVQNLAVSRPIFATAPVVENPETGTLLEAHNLIPVAKFAPLRGIADDMMVYEIP
jgi:class 3 adenylate cyclase